MEKIYNKLVRDNIPEIIKLKNERKQERGGFSKNIFLEGVNN